MRTKLVNEKYYADTYSDVDINTLCNIGEISPTDLEKFRYDLEDIAALYRWENSKYEARTGSSDTVRELRDVSKQANKLLSTLEGISWEAQSKIDAIAQDDGFKDLRREPSDDADPSLTVSFANNEGDVQCVIVDVPIMRSLLGGLVNASEAGIEKLPKGTPGRTRSMGLRLWMHNAQIIWPEISDQPFSRDVTSSNEPVTSAAQFCVAAVQMINPECPTSLIMKEMKRCIKYSRNRTGRISSQIDS